MERSSEKQNCSVNVVIKLKKSSLTAPEEDGWIIMDGYRSMKIAIHKWERCRASDV